MTNHPETAHPNSEAEIAGRADAYFDAAQKMTKAEGVKYFAGVADDDPRAFAELFGRLLDEGAEHD